MASALLLLAFFNGSLANADEPAEVPATARFDLEDVGEGRYELAGRLGLRRQFMGTRATPPYRDMVMFHCFKGDELKRLVFADPDLERRMVEQLSTGSSLPVVVAVRFEFKRIGHDGINVRDVLIPHIETCNLTTAEAICSAAEAGKFSEDDSKAFKAALMPDLVKDGVTISLGNIIARSKVSPQGSPFSIHGIKVFNATDKPVAVEITGVTVEQDGVTQECKPHERSRTPQKWQVEAKSWADGIYEDGKMPGTLWMFSVPEPIKPEKAVTVRVELSLDGGDPLTLTRSVDPM